MKKLDQKQTQIFSIILLIISIIILIITTLGLIKTIKNKKAIKTANFEETMVEDNDLEQESEDNTEENIENLEELENIESHENNASNKSKSKNTSNSSSTNKNTYYIKVNYGANVVTIYTKDENNEYTVPYKAMICSTGTATPRSGTYGIKGRWRWLGLFGGVYGQYSTQIVGNILFHSVPYLEKGNPGSLEYWEYDKLGTTCSAGCIRLTVRDAKWIYNNIPTGTLVEFYSSSNPGPLRKTICTKNI